MNAEVCKGNHHL